MGPVPVGIMASKLVVEHINSVKTSGRREEGGICLFTKTYIWASTSTYPGWFQMWRFYGNQTTILAPRIPHTAVKKRYKVLKMEHWWMQHPVPALVSLKYIWNECREQANKHSQMGPFGSETPSISIDEASVPKFQLKHIPQPTAGNLRQQPEYLDERETLSLPWLFSCGTFQF